MPVSFRTIVESFEFVSSAQMYEHQAYLNKETGETYWHSEIGDDFEEPPEDLDDGKYIEIPHKNELDLGKKLVFDFVYRFLPDDAGEVESIFRKKGAYSRFKHLLAGRGALEQWYEFESTAEDRALREWCEDNGIETTD